MALVMNLNDGLQALEDVQKRGGIVSTRYLDKKWSVSIIGLDRAEEKVQIRHESKILESAVALAVIEFLTKCYF